MYKPLMMKSQLHLVDKISNLEAIETVVRQITYQLHSYLYTVILTHWIKRISAKSPTTAYNTKWRQIIVGWRSQAICEVSQFLLVATLHGPEYTVTHDNFDKMFISFQGFVLISN